MPSRVILSSASNEAMAATMLRLHRQEDTADALEGYQETVAGIYAAHATLLARARLLRDPSSTHYVTRSVYECQMLGSFRGMTAEEYGLRDDLYSDSHIIARLYETGLTWGWLYPPVFSLPPPDVFVDSNSLIVIVAASFPSLGEEPGGFAQGPLGQGQDGFWRTLCPETHGTFSLVLDFFPPMSTWVKGLHQGEETTDLRHIDVITMESRLTTSLRRLFSRNHRAAVSVIVAQRVAILRS